MSLQRILENLLIKYLSPYVDGLSADQLKADLWRGNIVLRNLALKKNLFAMLGVDTWQIVDGCVELIELKLPWKAIYTGEISVLVSGINVKVQTRQSEKDLKEVIDELRKGKLEALKIQTDSIIEKMKSEQEGKDTTSLSFVAKVTRKLLQNIKIQVSDVNCVAIADALKIGFGLPSLSILSTDGDFQQIAAQEVESSALHKRLLVENMTLSLDDQLFCDPIGVRICLAHEETRLAVNVEFSGNGGLQLSRQQYVTIRKEINRVEVEKENILNAWMPPNVQRMLPSDHRELKEEYISLIRLKLFSKEAVAQDKLDRLAIIEDAVDNFLLSKWQAVEVKKKNEQLKAETKKSSWINWFLGPSDSGDVEMSDGAETETLLTDDLNDESKLETVDVPSSMQLSVGAPSFAFSLMDEVQVIRICEGQTSLEVRSETKLDHNGLESYEWSVEICFEEFQIHTLPELPPVFAFLGDVENGFKVSVSNTLEKHRSVLSACVQAGSTQSYLQPMMFLPIARFVDVSGLGLVEITHDNPSYLQDKVGDAMEENEERWATMKNALQERSPDCISVQVDIVAPEFTITAPDGSQTQFGLGRLSVGTLEPCSVDAISMRCSLSDTTLQVTTSTKENFHVLHPIMIQLDAQVRQELSLSVDLVLVMEAITLHMAPQASQVLLTLPETLAGVAQFSGEVSAPVQPLVVYETPEAAREALASMQANLKERMLKAAAGDQHFTVLVKFPCLNLMLLDSLIPVLQTIVSLPEVRVAYTTGKETTLDVLCEKNFAWNVDFFNPRVGDWEPVIEPWECALAVKSGDSGLDISCRATTPLLVNVTPTAVQTLSWFIPHILSSPENAKSDGEAKWRVLNVTQMPIDCRFWRDGAQVGQMTVEPCDQDTCWVSMDHCVTSTMAECVTLHGSEGSSKPLVFGMLGTTVLGKIHASMIKPHPSHKLLLLSFQHTLHNTLDIPMEIGFEGQFASDLRGLVAPRAMLDNALPTVPSGAQHQLLPQEFVSIPHAGIFLRPAGCTEWSEKISGSQIVRILRGTDTQFYRLEWSSRPSGPPFNGEIICGTVSPALLIRNTLPIPIVVSLEQTRVLELQCEPLSVTAISDFDPTAEISLMLLPKNAGAVSVCSCVPAKATDVKRVSMMFTKKGGSVDLVVSLGYTITVAATWLINRSDMALSFVDSKGGILPESSGEYGGVVLLPECNFAVSNSDGTQTVEIPSDFGSIQWATSAVSMQICTLTHHRVIQILPAFIFTNKTSVPLRVRTSDGERILPPLESSVYNGCSASLEFTDASSWSKPVRMEGAAAGAWAYVIEDRVYTVELCPRKNMVAISFSLEPIFVFCHHGPAGDVTINGSFVAKQGSIVPFGWTDPMGEAASQIQGDLTLIINGQSVVVNVHRKCIKSSVVPGHNIRVVGKQGRTEISFETENWWELSKDICVNIAFSRLGLSLVSETFMEELFYIQADLLRSRICLDAENDAQIVDLVVADFQVDCQLASRIACERTEHAQHETLFQEKLAGNRAVIFGSTGDTEFIVFSVVRVATASHDMVIQKFDLQFSSLETNIDDQVITSAQDFVAASFPNLNTCPCETSAMFRLAQTPILANFVCPPVPSVLHVDDMRIGQMEISAWLSLSLKNMDFLPQAVKILLYTVTFSQTLTVEGATICLEENKVAFRGPASDLALTLVAGYRNSILKSFASVLGCSSLLNLPRVPLQLAQNVGNFSIGAVSTVIGETCGLLSHLTFDPEYIAKQKRLRERKKISGLGTGFTEGLKSVGSATCAVFDIFTKPIEGAKKKGVKGFFSGLAKGAVGTIVKPITKLGEAAEDITSGIAAAVGTNSQQVGVKRCMLLYRTRKPRLLFREFGALRCWSSLEAHVLMNLCALCRGVYCVIPIGKTNDQDDPFFVVLLLYASSMRLAKLPLPSDDVEEEESSIFAALDKTGDKLLGKLVVPLRTVAKTGEMIAHTFVGDATQEGVPEEILKRIMWSVSYSAIKRFEDQGDVLTFFDDADAYCVPSQLLPITLRKSLAEMILKDRILWSELQLQVSRMLHDKSDFDDGATQTEQVVYVYQVQRFNLVRWVAPFLLSEPDKRRVWMDLDMNLHPKLISTKTRRELASAEEPPIDIGSLWTPSSAWEIELEGDVDEEGWAYALNWGASVWEARKSWVDVVRRRLWKRTYK